MKTTLNRKKLTKFISAFLALTFSFAVGFLVVILGAITLPIFGVTEGSVSYYTLMMVLQMVGLGIGAYIYLRWQEKWDKIRYNSLSIKEGGIVIGGTFLLLTVSIAASYVLSQMGITTASNATEILGNRKPIMFLILVPISLLLVGPIEELIFRGIIQQILKEAFSPLFSILIASLMFGVIHTVSIVGAGKIAYIGVVSLLGIILGVAYEYTDNLLVPSLIHGLYDAILFLSSWLVMS